MSKYFEFCSLLDYINLLDYIKMLYTECSILTEDAGATAENNKHRSDFGFSAKK